MLDWDSVAALKRAGNAVRFFLKPLPGGVFEVRRWEREEIAADGPQTENMCDEFTHSCFPQVPVFVVVKPVK